MSNSSFEQINRLTKERTPFLCIISFDKSKLLVKPLNEIDPNQLLYAINGVTNVVNTSNQKTLSRWNKNPIKKDRYRKAFDIVQQHQHYGDSFLLNLTFPTKLDTNLSLREIFHASEAKYKVWQKDLFVTFSPEPFIKIKDGVVSSYPMKGTIRSSEPDASNVILNNVKETEEHLTIVDLIRNDLGMVASNIAVDSYRYLENIKTAQTDLLQVSSKISGQILQGYWPNLGDLLETILPAGSVTGAPKKKTLEIIKSVEGYSRGYFTGMVGLFDGSQFDSGVMIRFVERIENELFFKSGGGITVNSIWENEYQEMIDKVYVPII